MKQTMVKFIKVTATLDEWYDWLTNHIDSTLRNEGFVHEALWKTVVDGKAVRHIGYYSHIKTFKVYFESQADAVFSGDTLVDLYFDPMDIPIKIIVS